MDFKQAPLVSVVIPTTLRRDIAVALRSAKDQTLPVEVVLVVDQQDSISVPDDVTALADNVVYTGGQRGAPFARNLGVAKSSGRFIAYLDDDDSWHPTKIERQLSAINSVTNPDSTIVSCRVRQRAERSNSLSPPVPRSVYTQEQVSLGDYLFKRRGPSVTRNAVFLPTLLVPKRLAEFLRWDESLARHQDWDWLLRAADAGARLIQLDEVLATVTVGSIGSISATSNWRSSLTWADDHRQYLSRAAYTDFLAGQVLRFALASRQMSGVSATTRALFNARTVPSPQSLALGLVGAVPRKLLENVAFAFARASASVHRAPRGKYLPPGRRDDIPRE